MATFRIQDRSFSCPVELALSVLDGKWKVLILWNLRRGAHRYSELRDTIDGISDKMLAQQLRDLEADGLIDRTVYPVVPPKTEYTLTDEGRRMEPVLSAMQQWGLAYKEPAPQSTQAPPTRRVPKRTSHPRKYVHT